jgi:hypothetical protein
MSIFSGGVPREGILTEKQIEEFEKHERQVQSILREMSVLSDKKPHDKINEFKLTHINNTLRGLNSLLESSRPLPEFEVFDKDSLPSNSDVVFVLAQYTDAVYDFRDRHTKFSDGKYRWILNGNKKVVTEPPIRFRYARK